MISDGCQHRRTTVIRRKNQAIRMVGDTIRGLHPDVAIGIDLEALGMCLLHAVSQAMFGDEFLGETLEEFGGRKVNLAAADQFILASTAQQCERIRMRMMDGWRAQVRDVLSGKPLLPRLQPVACRIDGMQLVIDSPALQREGAGQPSRASTNQHDLHAGPS